ncbi:MAG: CoB--CoM heterodisulfide reductase iron-sulfur subunit B family protein [Candidatus Aminicenantes bacterium]|nr:CoB--CoM heterodisulfide reductase iron-sulfur subunit B family protein [Candidatus Aminicenantes bacterium]
MRYAYYPGCSLHSTAFEYDLSMRAVLEKLGIEYEELRGWICCGTSPAHCSSKLLGVTLPIKNLAIAEEDGFRQMIVPCASCFSRLKIALHETSENPELREKVEQVLNYAYQGSVEVRHPLDILYNEGGLERIRESVREDLSRMKVVCYYGCLLTRPPKAVNFDQCEYPMTMDNLLKGCGIDVLDWSYKTDCCGAGQALALTNIVVKLSRDILVNAKQVGAEAVAVACPLCHSNLDARQSEIEQTYKLSLNLPIFYFSQLIALAMGVDKNKIGLQGHLVNPFPLLNKIKSPSSPARPSRG